MRRSLVACCASLVFTISAPAASGATCGASLPANGTGYVPPTNAASLPDDVPRPGPDVLYRRLRGAPQLRNTGVWRAAPIMVSGATAYRSGEFVYQDWLYDDTGLAVTENQGFTSTNHFGYPDDPRSAGDNAAD